MIYSAAGQTTTPRSPGLSASALRAMTRVGAPALCPELSFPTLPFGLDFDSFRSANEGLLGAAVPYWSIAWPGGQALARYLLDHPQAVQDRCVVDLGCGSGIVAVAAALGGAARVVAVDGDPNALIATAETARLNGVEVATCLADFEDSAAHAGAVILAGDLWYEREVGRRATRTLRRLADDGRQVICGDAGRPGRPREQLVEKARYCVPASQAFERQSQVECRVFELLASPMPQGHSSHASGAEAHRAQGGETGCGITTRRSRPAMIDDDTRS